LVRGSKVRLSVWVFRCVLLGVLVVGCRLSGCGLSVTVFRHGDRCRFPPRRTGVGCGVVGSATAEGVGFGLWCQLSVVGSAAARTGVGSRQSCAPLGVADRCR